MTSITLTNKFGLPAAFVEAVTLDSYDPVGDISVSGLKAPIQQTILMRRYANRITEDVSSRLWALLGKAMHRVMDDAGRRGEPHRELIKAVENLIKNIRATHSLARGPEEILVPSRDIVRLIEAFEGLPAIEERLAILIDRTTVRPITLDQARELHASPHEGIIVTGQTDFVHGTRIDDYKLTNVYAHKMGSRLDEWYIQLGLYTMLLAVHGRKIDSVNILEMLRDWVASQVGRQREYPERAVFEFQIELMPLDEAFAYASSRASLILDNLDTPDDQLPPCTDEERWYRGRVFAVMKIGAKRAVNGGLFKVDDLSVEQAKADAEALAASKGAAYAVVDRPGVNPRCEEYCAAADVCHQWATLKALQPAAEDGQQETE
jgi:hypothetical protein